VTFEPSRHIPVFLGTRFPAKTAEKIFKLQEAGAIDYQNISPIDAYILTVTGTSRLNKSACSQGGAEFPTGGISA